MKTALIAIMAMGFSGVALADGFVCDTMDGAYTVKVYNQTEASAGTRNAAIMVISDNSIQYGRKTIATIEASDELLENEGARYVANVDLRYAGTKRAGENLFGTKLGNVDAITLDVDFSYDYPVRVGDELTGTAIILKRNGQRIVADMACTRYLKN